VVWCGGKNFGKKGKWKGDTPKGTSEEASILFIRGRTATKRKTRAKTAWHRKCNLDMHVEGRTT